MIKRHAKLNLTPGRTVIEVNGQPLTGVTSITLHGAVREIPSLTVDLLLNEAEVDGEVVVTVPTKTADTLVALGWTAPAEPGQGR